MTEVTDEVKDRAMCIIPVPIWRYEGEPFVIVESWEELSDINQVLNLELAGDVFGEWAPVYLETGRSDPFSDFRLGNRTMPDGSVRKSADLFDEEVRPPYSAPEGLVELGDVCHWGFSDEYATCSYCNGVVRTMADCYAWTPDYWDSEYGYVCGDCVRGDPDDYLENRVNRGMEGELVTCNLIKPGDHGFRIVASGLEYGMHEHQNDDPRKIAQWAIGYGLQCVFVVSSSQFSQSFDVWMRRVDDDGCLFDLVVSEVEDALLESKTEYGSVLRRKFRQYPTPASLMKQSLKAASAAGERFVKHHGDGTYTAYETVETMEVMRND